MRSEWVATWLLTFALHAGALLLLAWLVDRGRLRMRLAWRELLWRVALFGAVLSASLQSLSGVPGPARFVLPPIHSHIAIETARVVAPPVRVAAADRAAAATPDAAGVSIARVDRRQAITAPSAFAWPSWHAMVVAAWLAGVLLVLSRLAIAWRRLVRRLAKARPATRATLAADATSLADSAGIATPRLSVNADLGSPLAAPGHRIVIPAWTLERLDRDQLSAMLAHEIAHLARRDPLWKLLAALCGALLWFLPLTPLARRRLDEIAELRCDQWAARQLGDGRALAECLAECANHHLGGIEADLVPAMAHRDSPLVERIDHLIEGTPLDTTCTFTRGAFAATLALVIAAFVLPGVGARAQPPAPPAPPAAPAPPAPPAPPPGDGSHAHVSRQGGGLFGLLPESTTVEVNRNGERFSARIRGEIEFNERDDAIARMEDDASASFEQTTRGITRRIDYSSRGGRIAQRYFVEDHEQAIDEEGRAWIAALLPMVVRETAVNVGPRVKRIHAAGGADAVVDEVGRIRSDHSRGAHLRELFALGTLTPAQATRVIGLIDDIDSDYEARNVLAALAASTPLDPGHQLLVLAKAGDIDSDYERAELLVGMLPQLAPGAEVRAAWLAATSGIDSDYEHRRVLSALLEAGNHDDATLHEVIDAAESIGSDYERRALLVGAIERIGDADRIASTYAAAAAGIDSDYERREALLALVRAPKFGTAGVRAVLDAASGIDSGHERVEVLVEVARVMPPDAALIERYRQVTRGLSDHERGAAERALDRFAG